MSGIFITFEGPDGSGKTTAINEISKYFNNLGFDTIITREPGGSALAEKIRDILLDTNNNVNEHAEALLYAASRAQHVSDTIKPALSLGKVVLCDRFLDSSLAYQGVARNLGINSVLKLSDFAMQGVVPNLTIFFDLKPEIGLTRIKKNRSHEINRLDLEHISFHEKVYNGYKAVSEMFPDRIKTIDASLSIPEVLSQSLNVIKQYLNSKNN